MASRGCLGVGNEHQALEKAGLCVPALSAKGRLVEVILVHECVTGWQPCAKCHSPRPVALDVPLIQELVLPRVIWIFPVQLTSHTI